MEYRMIGRTGIKVSPLVLGTDNFANPAPEGESARILDAAIEAGINLIDTSDSYAQGECERIIGRALNAGGKRNRVLLATKVYYPTGPGPDDRGNSRAHIMKACEDSLRRLQTDCIDLYQLHRPDFTVPHEETLSALTDLVRQGKVRHIGSSTAPAWRVMEGLMISELNDFVRFVSEQPPYNLLDRRIENELIPMCRAHDIAVFSWSPMAMGLLAGRYTDPDSLPADSRAVQRGGIYAERLNRQAIETGRQFVRLANDYGISPARLAVLWVKEQAGITAPVIGPKTVEQLEHLLPVLTMKAPEGLFEACNRLVPPGSFVANFLNTSGWSKEAAEKL
jgi:aryl-alcohol dehydrogenase-like predicted oxidoreductase